MDAADLAQLLTPQGMALLDRTPSVSDDGEIVRVVSRLRAEGHDPGLVAAVLTQAKLRQKARGKFGDFAGRMLFTEAGLEQATRLAVAAQHAGRFAAAGLRRVADLGCGIGGDAMAMAALDLDVTRWTGTRSRQRCDPQPRPVAGRPRGARRRGVLRPVARRRRLDGPGPPDDRTHEHASPGRPRRLVALARHRVRGRHTTRPA